jgi:hypothetical protein
VLRYPAQIEATADGGFLFSDGDGLHKVGADGLIQTLFPPHPPHAYQIADGGTVYDTNRKLSEFRNGEFAPIIQLQFDRGFFPAWGDRLPTLNMRECCIWDAEPLEGGAFVATTLVELLLVAPPDTKRLGVAIARETLPALLRRRLVVRSTLAAKFTVTLSRRGNVAAKVRATGQAGLSRIQLPSDLRRGLYTVSVQAMSADGSRVMESRRLLVGPFLPTRVARELIDGAYTDFTERNEYVRSCKRFGRRRVDCIVAIYGDEYTSPQRCAFGVVGNLRRSGYVMLRRYRCGAARRNYFDARPSWTRRPVQAPSLESLD